MSARDELDGWADEHGVSDPDLWLAVQPVRLGPEDNPRGAGFEVWDDNGDIYWVGMPYEDYADTLDYFYTALGEGDIMVVIEDERAYA